MVVGGSGSWAVRGNQTFNHVPLTLGVSIEPFLTIYKIWGIKHLFG